LRADRGWARELAREHAPHRDRRTLLRALRESFRPAQRLSGSARQGFEGEDEVVSRGGSCIVDPLGNVLVGPNYEGECLLTAEIDRNALARGKFDMDVVGHYARPDVFKLVVNEADTPAVVFTRENHE